MQPDEHVRELLAHVIPNVDWSSEHLRDTPERFVGMLRELTDRSRLVFQFKTFENVNHIDEMVVLQDIPFKSLCAHHLLPFVGTTDVAYLPDWKLAGLSKLARAVQFWSAGLWVQEDLTERIANFIQEKLEPKGVAVVMRAEHFCMSLRGASVVGTKTTTSKMTGAFLDPTKGARQEFLQLIRSK